MTKAAKPFKPNIHSLEPYPVGYGKPPRDNQFKQGQSGNPQGRPKGSTNKPSHQRSKLHDILLHEAYRTVTIQDKDGPLQLSVAQAAMRSLALKAAQGHVGAQKLFIESLHSIETEYKQEQQALFEAAFLYKKRMSEQIKKRKNQEISIHEDELLPHPDHIRIDVRTAKVTFTGPIDLQDKKVWDELWAQKKACEEDLELFTQWSRNKKASTKQKSRIEQAQSMLEMVEQAIILRWDHPIENVVLDPKRRQLIQDRVQRIQNGTLNFDGSEII